MADIKVDVTYFVTLFGNGPFYCVVPDFSLLTSGATKEEAMSNAQELVQVYVDNSESTGKAVPTATPRSVLERKWNSEEYEFNQVVVRV